MNYLRIVSATASWLAIGGGLLVAGEPAPAAKAPHINLATSYCVDPTWPKRPKQIVWGEMPSVAIDKGDRVWVCSRVKPFVPLYDADGRFVRGWGDDVLVLPHGMRLDPEGNIWVTDARLHIVVQFTPQGKVLKTLGTRGVHGNDRTHFNMPTDVAPTPTGDVFVSDGYGNNRIVRFDRNGRFVKEWGKLGVGPGEFSVPHNIVRDAKGRLYVADRSNCRVQVFDQDGKFLDQWCNLFVPWGLCLGADGDVWVCGSSPMTWTADQLYLGCPPKDQLVMRLNPQGRVLALWMLPKGKDGKEQAGEVNWLHGIALDSHGNLYAADIIGRRVQKFIKHAPDVTN